MKTTRTNSKRLTIISPIVISLTVLILFTLYFFAVPFWARMLIKFNDRSGVYHNHAVAVDIDADGDMDVLETGARNESESVMFAHSMLWLNDGVGEFTPFTGHALAEFYYPSGAAGDVDADGDLDLIMLGANTITVYPNRATAPAVIDGENTRRSLLFDRKYNIHAPPNVAEAPGSHSTLISADFNLDGRADALVAGCCGSTFGMQDTDPVYFPPASWIWFSGNLQPDGPATGDTLELKALRNLPVREVAVGDFDGDGAPDVFAAVMQTELPSLEPGNRVLINDRTGNLIDSGQRLGGHSSTSVALGDLDGDGDLDAVTGTTTGAQAWFNTRGKFFPGAHTLEADPTLAVFVADIDTRNGLDVILIGEKRATIWLNEGSGHFTFDHERVGYGKHDALVVAPFHDEYRYFPVMIAFDAAAREYDHPHSVEPMERMLWRIVLDY